MAHPPAAKEERVMRDPELAALIRRCCNAVCAFELLLYFGLVNFLFAHGDSWWQAIVWTITAAPPVVGTLFGFSLLKQIYINKYAMEPRSISSGRLTTSIVAEKQAQLDDLRARLCTLETDLSRSRQEVHRFTTEMDEKLGVEQQTMEELKKDIRVISHALSQRDGKLHTKSKAILKNYKASHQVATLP